MIIVFLIVIYPTIQKEIQKEKQKGITAKEGNIIANEIAKQWNTNVIIGSVSTIDNEFFNGKSKYWIYGYYNPDNLSSFIDVKVYASGKYELVENDIQLNISINQPEWNWNIDSNEAYEIMMKVKNIKEFMSKYEIDTIEYSLGGKTPSWFLLIESYGYMDNPHNAQIIINATNGSIVDVQT